MADSATVPREANVHGPFLVLFAGVVLFTGLAMAVWYYWITQDRAFLMLVGAGLLSVAVLALYVAVAVWVYSDAVRVGLPALPWVLVVVLMFVLGLLVYLVVREFRPERWRST